MRLPQFTFPLLCVGLATALHPYHDVVLSGFLNFCQCDRCELKIIFSSDYSLFLFPHQWGSKSPCFFVLLFYCIACPFHGDENDFFCIHCILRLCWLCMLQISFSLLLWCLLMNKIFIVVYAIHIFYNLYFTSFIYFMSEVLKIFFFIFF